MAEVSVKFFGRVREALGADEVRLGIKDGETVGALLSRLLERFGETFSKTVFDPNTGSLRNQITVLLNGVNVMTKSGLETMLSQNDLVFLLTPAAGG